MTGEAFNLDEFLEKRGIDLDLWTGSDFGFAARLNELWNVLRRYILRGDEHYQFAALTVVAAVAWHFPLDECADVLEQYFAKQGYFPQTSGRGGIALASLKAAY